MKNKKIILSLLLILIFPLSAKSANKGFAHLEASTSKLQASEVPLGFGQPLISVTGVDLKNTGQTTLYTVPSGKALIITDIIPVITAIDTVAVFPIIRIGKASSYNEWLSLTTIPSVTAAGQAFSLNTSGALAIRSIFTAGEVVSVDVQTAATATTLTATFHVFGYLI